MSRFIDGVYGCFSNEGYAISAEKHTRYLGKKREVASPSYISGTINFSNKEQVSRFKTWYDFDINNGGDYFNIVLPYFGVIRELVVVFADDITISENFSSGYMQVSMRVLSVGAIKDSLLVHIPLEDNLSMIRGEGIVNFSRNSIASYINKDTGLISYAEANEARFEKDGLLVEKGVKNILLHTKDFSNDVWNKISGGTGTEPGLSSLTYTAPDGISEASIILFNKGAGVTIGDYSGLVQGVNIIEGETYTFSLWMKITNGIRGIEINIAGASPVVQRLDSNNDWVRVSTTWTSTLTGPSHIRILLKGDNELSSGAYVALWGGQFEKSAYPSSYIPTDSVPVDRLSDKCWLDYDGNFPRYSTKDTTVAFEYSINNWETNTSQVLFAIDYDTNFWAAASYNGDFKTSFFNNSGSLFPPDQNLDGINKLACITGDTYAHMVKNVNEISPQTFVEDKTGSPTVICIGSYLNGAYPLNGHIKNFRIWDYAMTDEEAKRI